MENLIIGFAVGRNAGFWGWKAGCGVWNEFLCAFANSEMSGEIDFIISGAESEW